MEDKNVTQKLGASTKVDTIPKPTVFIFSKSGRTEDLDLLLSEIRMSWAFSYRKQSSAGKGMIQSFYVLSNMFVLSQCFSRW